MNCEIERVLNKKRNILGNSYSEAFNMFYAVYERVKYSQIVLDKIPNLVTLSFNTSVNGEKDTIKCLEKILRLKRQDGKIVFLDSVNLNGSISIGNIRNYSNYLLKMANAKYKKEENINLIIRRVIGVIKNKAD